MTFGFEAEYGTSVEPLARRLHADTLKNDPILHNYTCECSGCTFEEDYDGFVWPFRAKHDSSCGGEVISKILSTDDWDEARNLVTALERAAVDTDAEPSLSAGFHVHVGKEHMRPVTRGKLVWAMVKWEDALGQLAAGRFPSNRGWNQTMSSVMLQYVWDWLIEHTETDSRATRSCYMSELAPNLEVSSDFYRFLAAQAIYADRHSTVALGGRHPTVEFRIWNSTRSAWRMELWCRVSVLLGTATFINKLVEFETPAFFGSLEQLVTLLEAEGDDDLSPLVRRQRDYLASLDHTGHSMPFAMA